MAAAFVLAVTFPEAGNIGGGGFMLIWLAGPGRAVYIDFRGKARSKAAAILATIQGSRQLARIHGADMLEATFAQIRTDLGLET